MLIATWNLNHLSLNGQYAKNCLKQMADIKADIWVLTEVHETIDCSTLIDSDCNMHRYTHVSSSEPLTEFFKGTMVAIWAKEGFHGCETTTIQPTMFTACGEFQLSGSHKLWVYGTVLPWRGSSKWLGNYTFGYALDKQQDEWKQLNQPDHGWLCVAGDFNQELNPAKHFYGSGAQEKSLKVSLEKAHLDCLTAGHADPVAREFPPAVNIDHICVSHSTRKDGQIPQTRAWQKLPGTDHHCVAVEFSFE